MPKAYFAFWDDPTHLNYREGVVRPPDAELLIVSKVRKGQELARRLTESVESMWAAPKQSSSWLLHQLHDFKAMPPSFSLTTCWQCVVVFNRAGWKSTAADLYEQIQGLLPLLGRDRACPNDPCKETSQAQLSKAFGRILAGLYAIELQRLGLLKQISWIKRNQTRKCEGDRWYKPNACCPDSRPSSQAAGTCSKLCASGSMSAAGINVRRICTDCSHSFGLQAPANATAMSAMVMVVIKTKSGNIEGLEENLPKKQSQHLLDYRTQTSMAVLQAKTCRLRSDCSLRDWGQAEGMTSGSWRDDITKIFQSFGTRGDIL